MNWIKKYTQKSPEEKLKRRIRKKVKNQSDFFKHAITYLVLFLFGLMMAFLIRDEGFTIPFLILFSCWLLGLVFHGLSAFVFHRIDTWEETMYYKKLAELRLLDDPEIEEDSGQDMDEDFLELPTYKNLRKEKDERWNESDLV